MVELENDGRRGTPERDTGEREKVIEERNDVGE